MSGKTGKASRRSNTVRISRTGGPIHVEELDLDHLNPFHDDVRPQHHRWLITTCVAGMAGSVVIGTVLLGVFGTSDSRWAGGLGLGRWRRDLAAPGAVGEDQLQERGLRQSLRLQSLPN